MTTQVKEYASEPQSVTETRTVSEVEAAVGASFIAGGIGITTMGLTVIASEMSSSIGAALTLNSGVGSLSGKSTVAVLAFLISWGILHYVMKDKNIKLMTSFLIGIGLTLLGILLTFPPIFLSFKG